MARVRIPRNADERLGALLGVNRTETRKRLNDYIEKHPGWEEKTGPRESVMRYDPKTLAVGDVLGAFSDDSLLPVLRLEENERRQAVVDLHRALEPFDPLEPRRRRPSRTQLVRAFERFAPVLASWDASLQWHGTPLSMARLQTRQLTYQGIVQDVHRLATALAASRADGARLYAELCQRPDGTQLTISDGLAELRNALNQSLGWFPPVEPENIEADNARLRQHFSTADVATLTYETLPIGGRRGRPTRKYLAVQEARLRGAGFGPAKIAELIIDAERAADIDAERAAAIDDAERAAAIRRNAIALHITRIRERLKAHGRALKEQGREPR